MENVMKEITSMEKDFAKWYTDVVKKAKLMDYSGVRGCMILEPYGCAIWENIQKILDKKFKDLNHENVLMPLLISESLLQQEKDHIEGFAPEVAWVTHGGNEKLEERLCIRPTSEVLFCDYFSKKIKSWRDLPKLYNQWCNVVRWEKTTRPFLRTVEFYWQEGHTIHETEKEAREETEKMLNLYFDFLEKDLCIFTIKGQKTEKEKFAGAETTYTIEAMMHDGKILQSATSHYFGNSFAKAFGIKYRNKFNQESFPYQTSWGLTTRVIGGIIMTHGDNKGLVLPPSVAPIQIIIIPINLKNKEIIEKSLKIYDILNKNFRVKLDLTDQTPGWKFSEYEMKGVPLRLEFGPKDLKNNQCVLVKRNTSEKKICNLENLEENICLSLDELKFELYEESLKRTNDLTYLIEDNFEEILDKKYGFIKSSWCGNSKCEDLVKEKYGVTSRCIIKKNNANKCPLCGENSSYNIYWGKSY
ncbi:MAG: proline--tRNA ligase [Candidatus Paraimprobicoccus trichonymphae]|uniref:Proline--tRNA ligase n=1 Tax=Candidatus Paraimprobicoccus trichonymphae TaxID=3033793 RepID=A0AA48KWB1_9FIRM|nr:MAG: proline--tRNA ligase [Candidatus Paraimprobicoccus trichonymphae]